MTYRLIITRTFQRDRDTSFPAYHVSFQRDVARHATFEICMPISAFCSGWYAMDAHAMLHVINLDPVQDQLLPFFLSIPRSHKYLTVVLTEHDEVFERRMNGSGHIWYPVKPDPHPVIFSSESGYEYSKIEIPIRELTFHELLRTCSFSHYFPDSARRIFDAIIAQQAASITDEEHNDETHRE